MNSDRIYLDNAATSWPKPESVYQAVETYQRENGAPAGRSAYHDATHAEWIVGHARGQLADLIRAESPSNIVFTFNGTDSLNLAIHGLLKSGDHVVTSVVEHNSVLRPLKHLEQTRGIRVTRVDCDGQGRVNPDDIEKAITSKTRLVAIIHASNVTGVIQPVEEIGRIARQHGLIYLVDAAQTAGHLPINVGQMGAHLLAAPGHKSLLGPLGTGFLYIAQDAVDLLQPLRQGGTGTQSEQDIQPSGTPEKFESGNHNVAGLAGLAAGLELIRSKGVSTLREHQQRLTSMLLDGLSELSGVTTHGPSDEDERVGVVSLTMAGYDPQEIASLLDTEYAIQIRAGIHCAPLIHERLSTGRRGGTARVSIGPFNTEEQVETTIRAIGEVAASATVWDDTK